jgi:site-specific DNA-methyltransferase (adenine-specific)
VKDHLLAETVSKLPEPYWRDELLTLYCGDALQLLPLLQADCIITDPPYGETNLEWDRWQHGWPSIASAAAPQMWCFGSFRMFFTNVQDFEAWRIAQDVIWEKHNGTSLHNDRFRRVHELAVHFYRGEWAELYKKPVMTNDATARTVRRKRKPAHWGGISEGHYQSEDGGPRLMASVIYARSCHGDAVHPTQKPEAIIAPLVEYSVAPGGLVLDCFAGSGTVLAVARKAGRRAIGIEAREEYCRITVDRLAQREMAI